MSALLGSFALPSIHSGAQCLCLALALDGLGPEGWIEQLQAGELDSRQRALVHGYQANEALRRCRRYVAGWLAHADEKSGLIPAGLSADRRGFWNGRDAAADNYVFMVLTSALTDRELFAGRMLDMLRAEERLTSRLGALPADYSFADERYVHAEADVNRLVFDGAEYVKDGLMPITEWLGASPWSERMIGIVDSILEHAPFETEYGPIPSNNVEVNGDMMQVLGRLRFFTGEEKYLEMACRIADYYLLGSHHPTRDMNRLRLDDHSCELVSGLTEVYAACRALRPAKAEQYRQPIAMMLDRILQTGVDEHGLMYEVIDPQSGAVVAEHRTDNWGYNYNAFYTVFQLDGVERYRLATQKALGSLKPHYMKYPWEGWGSDGIADAVEGALNLYNREPAVEGVGEWIDANIARMFAIQQPDGVIEGWHGDGNFARTAILWALWKQQGATVQPWREDVILGAVREGGAVLLALAAKEPWKGTLALDAPRHRTTMHLPSDYPRINQFPEWFTVEDDANYNVDGLPGGPRRLSGRELRQGVAVEIAAGGELHLKVAATE